MFTLIVLALLFESSSNLPDSFETGLNKTLSLPTPTHIPLAYKTLCRNMPRTMLALLLVAMTLAEFVLPASGKAAASCTEADIKKECPSWTGGVVNAKVVCENGVPRVLNHCGCTCALRCARAFTAFSSS